MHRTAWTVRFLCSPWTKLATRCCGVHTQVKALIGNEAEQFINETVSIHVMKTALLPVYLCFVVCLSYY